MTETNKRIRVQIDLTPSRYQKLKALADAEARTISSYCIYHLLLKEGAHTQPQVGDAICAYPASAYVNQDQPQPQGEPK